MVYPQAVLLHYPKTIVFGQHVSQIFEVSCAHVSLGILCRAIPCPLEGLGTVDDCTWRDIAVERDGASAYHQLCSALSYHKKVGHTERTMIGYTNSRGHFAPWVENVIVAHTRRVDP